MTRQVELKQTYYDNEQLHWETPWENEQRHGISKGYYENGQLMWETPYVEGERHGVEKDYYDDGKLYRETIFVNGEERQELINDIAGQKAIFGKVLVG